jgi:hypothetical protein
MVPQGGDAETCGGVVGLGRPAAAAAVLATVLAGGAGRRYRPAALATVPAGG